MALAPDSSIPVSDSSNVDRESSREGRRNVSYTPRLLSNGKITVWADFATFLQKVELTKYQVRNYFRQELDNNKIGADNHCRLILMGTYDTQRIQEILHGLIGHTQFTPPLEYISRHDSSTVLKFKAAKTYSLVCNECDSARSVANIPYGYARLVTDAPEENLGPRSTRVLRDPPMEGLINLMREQGLLRN